MKVKDGITIAVAIVCLTVIHIANLHYGIDGVYALTIISTISVLAGGGIVKVYDRVKGKP
jgi:riboflavin synthase alpha subunit